MNEKNKFSGRVQKLRDGRLDPLGRTSSDGFVIAVSDGMGGLQAWADQFFPTMDAANVTAARCVIGACEIQPARKITYVTGNPRSLHYHSKILIEESAVAQNS